MVVEVWAFATFICTRSHTFTNTYAVGRYECLFVSDVTDLYFHHLCGDLRLFLTAMR